MAHFAKLDSNNRVETVIVVNNEDTSDSNGVESESIGVAFCQQLFGVDTVWKQTSYNGNFRGNYAGIGFTYMSGVATLGVGSTDVFVDLQPYPSWTLSTTEAEWIPPSNPGPAPALTEAEEAASKNYEWNESNYIADPATAWVLTDYSS
tara:strand:- start:53 stop:499 length:447 start_codon:yes stop_codon:yes gene_type:complete